MKITQPCPSHDSYQKWFRANSSARNCGISLRKISKWKSIKLSFKLHFDRYYWPSGLLCGKYIFVKFQKLVAPQSHSWVAEPPHPQKSWLSKNICFYLYFYLCFSVYPHPHKSWLSKKNSFYLLYLFLSVFICVVCFICFNCEALYYHIAPDRIWRFKVLGIDLVHLWILAHVRHIDCHLQLRKPTTSLEAAWAGWGCEGLPRKGKDFKKLRRGRCRWWWRWPWQHGWGLPRDHWDSFPEHQPQPHICRYIWFDHQSNRQDPDASTRVGFWDIWCFQNLES